jgi:hypothetical protein
VPVVDDELEDPFRPIDVLELVFAQVAHCNARHLLVIDDPGRGAREQHLPSVRDRADASRSVDADAGVAVLGEVGLTGMQAHADGDPSLVRPPKFDERALGSDGGRDRSPCPFEDDEEGIPLRIHFASVVIGERGAKQIAVLRN